MIHVHGMLPLLFRLVPAVLLLLCVVRPLFALEGRVIDERTGAPVANAEVSILGRPGVTLTDDSGRFSWTPDPVPPFELLVILPGGRVLKPVLVESLGQGQPLLVKVTTLVEESVSVTGSAPSIESSPASGTTLLTSADLRSRQPVTLLQALETTPGVAVVSEGHASVPAIRGLARGRTLILLDGARVATERRVGPSATFVDPFTLDGIEIARGPGSVAYGSDAFGGVIYARTRRPEPGTPVRARGVLSGGAGIPQVRAGAEISKGFGDGGVLLLGHYRSLDDYRSPSGTIANSGAKDFGILGRVERRLGQGLFSASWQSDFGRDIERPRNNSNQVRFYYPEETSHRFVASYDRRGFAGFHRVNVSTFLGRHVLVTDQDRHASDSGPRGIERADVRANDFHLRGLGERHVGHVKLEFGGEVNGRFGLHALDSTVNFDSDGHETGTIDNISVDAAHRTDTGGYVNAEASVRPALVLAGGLRFDHVGTRNEGGYFGDRATTNSAMSAIGSVTAGPYAGWSVTGQVARGFRDPFLSDRYFRGPSGRGFITGLPDLRSETSLQFDAAVRHTGSRHRLAFYAYQYRISDLVERYEGAPDNFFFRNRGLARIRGIEVEAQLILGSGWQAELAAQLSHGVTVQDDAPLDDIAAPTISGLLRRQWARGTFAQLRIALFARDDEPGPTERDTPGYALLDAGVGLPLARGLELQVNGRNLLDADYLASPDPRTVAAPGGSVLASLLIAF